IFIFMATLLTKRRHIYFNIKIKWIHLKLKIIVITLNAGITRQLFLKRCVLLSL
ncbi:hypothetical protein CWK37_004151, partial [Salmonella enterica subsp. enterica serovar Saintpaul]|nr:hypothetical protein [Salmonella enterica subsp. enterica serovar Braenderup]EDT8107563.1 hypothetical protein [Salmonella enterica subsp. enterica serovar Anatum]EDU4962996.1 hypothetical protein [Salmonella enterica subsp. enterica serovar Saintpaul]EDX8762621.1 hypothetical protein [Salmonella enterica subsp. enterica serovar Hadar]EEH7110792.1 hypothetical protein [Salmonella enterica]